MLSKPFKPTFGGKSIAVDRNNVDAAARGTHRLEMIEGGYADDRTPRTPYRFRDC